MTVGRVVVASGVVKERINTIGRVVGAGGVGRERTPVAVFTLPVVLLRSAP